MHTDLEGHVELKKIIIIPKKIKIKTRHISAAPSGLYNACANP